VRGLVTVFMDRGIVGVRPVRACVRPHGGGAAGVNVPPGVMAGSTPGGGNSASGMPQAGSNGGTNGGTRWEWRWEKPVIARPVAHHSDDAFAKNGFATVRRSPPDPLGGPEKPRSSHRRCLRLTVQPAHSGGILIDWAGDRFRRTEGVRSWGLVVFWFGFGEPRWGAAVRRLRAPGYLFQVAECPQTFPCGD